MTIRWTQRALTDLERVHGFMESVSATRAVALVDALIGGVERLAELPRIGQRLTRYAKREVRRIFVGEYEVRYELTGSNILVLRLWHTREDR
jgi:plasmid stabilization system protein ParE